VPTATYEKIATTTLTTNGSFDFTTIPNTYTDLILTGQLRAAGGSSIVENAWMNFNSDFGANYGDMRGLFYSGGFLSTNNSDSQATFGAVSAPGASGWFYTPFVAFINNYASTSHYRTQLTSYITQNYEANYRLNNWLNTSAAINRIQFACGGSGGLFASGSTVSIWGIKAAA